MINLFHIPTHKIDTAWFDHQLHGKTVQDFENKLAEYVGAKYCCSLHSATMGIYLTFNGPWIDRLSYENVSIPSIIPYVVPNVLCQCPYILFRFNDNINWVGHSYILHQFQDFKVIDSAQDVYRNQFKKEANDNDLIIYSFYPTKLISGIDGGAIVSNDKSKIEWFRQASMYGAKRNSNTWDSWSKNIQFPGWKAYMNSAQAYVATKNLSCLNNKKERLTEIRQFYNDRLGYNNTSHHLYRININSDFWTQENFIAEMKEMGIQCAIHYRPVHRMEAYRPYINQTLELPISDREGNSTISIPFHEKLTNQETHYIARTINELN